MLYRFFTSYGWLVLFLMGTIIIIFNLGFFSFGLNTNYVCKLENGLGCERPFASRSEIGFNIVNKHYNAILIDKVTLANKNCPINKTYDTPISIGATKSGEVRLACETFPRITEGEITIHYRNKMTGLGFTEVGHVRYVTRPIFS